MSALTNIHNELTRRFASTQFAGDLIETLKTDANEAGDTYIDTVFSYDSDAYTSYNATRYRLGTSYMWFAKPGGTYDFSAVDVDTIQAGIDSHGSETYPLVINIEQWDMKTEYAEAIPNLITVASMWRDVSNRELGFFKLTPKSDYWLWHWLYAGVNGSDEEQEARYTSLASTWWDRNNQNYAQLKDYIDFLAPRCYVNYNGSQSNWNWYAAASIAEAVRLADGEKKVYPFVWYYAQGDNDYLTEAEWVSSLQFVTSQPGVDGVMVYHDARMPGAYEWRDAVSEIATATGDFAPPV